MDRYLRNGPIPEWPIHQARKSTKTALDQLVRRVKRALDDNHQYSLGLSCDIQGAFHIISSLSVADC